MKNKFCGNELNKCAKQLQKIVFFFMELCLIFGYIHTACGNENVIKEIFDTKDALCKGVFRIYPYHEESVYRINTQIGFITDVALQSGEKINNIASGASEKFVVDYVVINNIPHVYIKPKSPNIVTNIIIDTLQHSYRLLVNSGDTYDTVVCWKFPESVETQAKSLLKKEGTPVQYSKNKYRTEITGEKKWQDRFGKVKVFDDGERTYVYLPKRKNISVPLVYEGNKNHLKLINYRIKDNMIVIDKCAARFSLIFPGKQYINISSSE